MARAARERGLDAISSHEVARDGLGDDVQLAWAAQEGRCLVTRDVGDFPRLSRIFAENQRPHAGVLLIPRSLPDSDLDAIVQSLTAFSRLYPDGLPSYAVMYLRASKP